jgi:undecaprenyl-phosphate 4-deoxy-4-formamido-L-arabinose transferase
MIDYSVVVPVYRGEGCVKPLLESITAYFKSTSYLYEVIFVYDCGPDNSWEVLLDLKRENDERVKLIKLSRNFGQHNALICGFEYALGSYIITIDEDLQHNPYDISTLIEEQAKGDFDLVYGKYAELNHSGFRNISSRIFKKMIAVGIPDLHKDYSAFRLIKSHVAKATLEMRNSYTFVDGYFSWITQSVSSCIVSHNERLAGQSSYDLKKLIEHSINIFVTFSNLPIRFLIKFSLGLFFLTCFYSVYIVIRKIFYDDLMLGFPSLMLAIGFGVSFILLALGVVGEYMYRINLKTTRRPNYLIKDVL